MNDIHDIYPTKVLIKQLDISSEALDNIRSYLLAQYYDLYAQHGHKLSSADWVGIGGVDKPMLDNEYVHEACPEIKVLGEMLKQEGLNLAHANSVNYSDHVLTNKYGEDVGPEKFKIECEIESANINITETNDRMHMHTHYGDDAFGVLYFTDVAEEDGGKLVLHDPRWQRNYYFAGNKKFRVRPQRGTLVVAPNFLWHEIEDYFGEDDRMSLFFNIAIKKIKV